MQGDASSCGRTNKTNTLAETFVALAVLLLYYRPPTENSEF
jgi:hypothetical protein